MVVVNVVVGNRCPKYLTKALKPFEEMQLHLKLFLQKKIFLISYEDVFIAEQVK